MTQKQPKYRKKKKLGSYQYFSVILSITLALFVIGLFGLILVHAQMATKMVQENIEVQLYLQKNVSQNQKIQIQQTLATRSYAAKKGNQADLTFISKEEAASTFIKETGEDFVSFLGENPLRDAYILKINPEFHESGQLKEIKSELEQLSGVFEVVYQESLVEAINKNIAIISLVLVGIAAVMLLAIVILINNTIKLALFSQRFLIRSMQLVGAKSSFIQKPFLLRALLYGFISGVLASIMLYSLLRYFKSQVTGLEGLVSMENLLIIFTGMLFLGALIALISTYRAIKKYLGLSLDELY